MDISQISVSEEITVKEALRQLDKTGMQILLVVQEEVLEGVITDGDIRRWILHNGSLEQMVSKVMNTAPYTIQEADVHLAKEMMKELLLKAIPVVDQKNRLVDLITWDDPDIHTCNTSLSGMKVVIMAGGKGTRLYPYTRVLPKPLIPIGDVPIVERIIEKFKSFGCDDYYLTLNHKKSMVKTYFNDLDKEYKVHYVEEERPLGTAGSLSLMKDALHTTFIVSNCDILIDADYADIMKTHATSKNMMTIVASLKNVKIPYGVIQIGENESIQGIIEKPEYDFFVNTGMYILDPSVLKYIPDDDVFNMTDLIEVLLTHGEKIGFYPISEDSWMDMGQIKEMERMIQKVELK